MIIESAFWKLPELLTRDYDLLRGTSEATVVHLLAVAILMELNARNVQRPFQYVEVEKPYPIPRRESGVPIRADLFVDLGRIIPKTNDGPMALYGTRALNWIEAKTFFRSIKQGGTPARTANAGKIVRDLLRICLLPGQRLASRYLVLVFSGEPSQSLALQRSNQRERAWLSRLLTEGYIDDVSFNLADEPQSLRKRVGPGFFDSSDSELQFDLKLRTMTFQPKSQDLPSSAFWGYLIRIRFFHIAMPNLSVSFGDEPGQERSGQFIPVRDQILDKL